jgi:pimeloyl-ACP methyl ester carboxylesterase
VAGPIKHGFVDVNGVRLHVAEQGEGPLVLLLHGFPESWYSWRHQFGPLAEAGYRVVAPDQRGYGRSDRPPAVDSYTLPHLVGDVVALIRELGETSAVLVGHDMGGPVAWLTAVLRPDLVRGVAGLSTPPALPAGLAPTALSRETYGDGFYQLYFQQPGRADAELAVDPPASLRAILAGGSGGRGEPRPWVIPAGSTLLDLLGRQQELPDWLTEEDVAVFVEDYSVHGEHAFTGPLNWYRNIDRNHELLAALRGLGVPVPALYVVGDQDMVTTLRGVDRLRSALPVVAPKLHAAVTLPGCGHWTQQERPAEVNEALLDFLAHLAKDGGAHRE